MKVNCEVTDDLPWVVMIRRERERVPSTIFFYLSGDLSMLIQKNWSSLAENQSSNHKNDNQKATGLLSRTRASPPIPGSLLLYVEVHYHQQNDFVADRHTLGNFGIKRC